MWFLDQLQGSEEYHMPMILKLTGSVDENALRNALKNILSRHEVLRTVIKSEKGIGYQEVLPADSWSMEVVTVSEGEDPKALITAFIEDPFDLSRDYMLRSRLYRLGDGSHVFANVLHHIASDGWSNGILTNEFMESYTSLMQRGTCDFPTLPLQYADYAIWQRTHLEGDVLEGQLS
ncbi:condensation domain-containing protein, partial [Maribacter sp. 2-571]|uniref:condensation domain-containing protein n=1 Tax=Maribacter sp. 2-571 TaxID=3417569 RepID=UPI003D346A58